MAGPTAVESRGTISNYTGFQNDIRAAYQNAIMWYITKDKSHWTCSTSILDSWGTELEDIVGIDRSLFIGVEGSVFANAAEIMKYEGGWVEKGNSRSGTSGFSNQLYWLFARQSIIIGQASYGVASIAGLLHFAVYLGDVALWNYAMYSYQSDACAGITANLNIATGYDLFSHGNNLLLKGSEYAAKYNVNHTVPYDPKFYRCDANLVDGPREKISDSDRGVGYFDDQMNPACWDIIYYSALSRGLKAPWTERAKAQADATTRNMTSAGDPQYWGDLLFKRDT